MSQPDDKSGFEPDAGSDCADSSGLEQLAEMPYGNGNFVSNKGISCNVVCSYFFEVVTFDGRYFGVLLLSFFNPIILVFSILQVC